MGKEVMYDYTNTFEVEESLIGLPALDSAFEHEIGITGRIYEMYELPIFQKIITARVTNDIDLLNKARGFMELIEEAKLQTAEFDRKSSYGTIEDN